MGRPLFKLKNRLAMCANFVNKNSRIADIGTDHAYLPIWLAKSNIINFAIASDIKEGPIKIAKDNINKYCVGDIVRTRISDGLSNIAENEVDEVIIAGMGGELIIDILSKAPWLKSKNLILQPMTSHEKLRDFLKQEKYYLTGEKVIEENGKLYSIMNINPSLPKPFYDNLYTYIGLIGDNKCVESKKYIERKIVDLNNKIKGLEISKNFEKSTQLKIILSDLQKIF